MIVSCKRCVRRCNLGLQLAMVLKISKIDAKTEQRSILCNRYKPKKGVRQVADKLLSPSQTIQTFHPTIHNICLSFVACCSFKEWPNAANILPNINKHILWIVSFRLRQSAFLLLSTCFSFSLDIPQFTIDRIRAN